MKIEDFTLLNIILYSFLFMFLMFPDRYDLINLKFKNNNKQLICYIDKNLYKFNNKNFNLYKFDKYLIFENKSNNKNIKITKKEFYNNCLFKNK